MRKAVIALLLSSLAFAEGTRTWTQSRYEEFEKGTAKGVALGSDGALRPAPATTSTVTTPSTILWDLAVAPDGTVYAAAGAPARVYRITAAGESKVIFAPGELQVQALAVAADGALLAATSPDGKVYRIAHKGAPGKGEKSPTQKDAKPDAQPQAVEPGFAADVFFDPKTKYIWDLVFDREGRLYVATGDRGEIFRVDKDGSSSQFFKSDETHIRSLAFDREGNLIAGSDGSGLIYRITARGEGFVLYSAAKKEITALAVDPKGNIFAAGIGEKRGGAGQPATPTFAPQPVPQAPISPSITAVQPGITIAGFPAFGATGGSDVYQIAADGTPRRIWSSREDLVHALAFGRDGRLLAGTGNRGRVYAISSDGDFTNQLKVAANQVSAFASAADGALILATSNLGKVVRIGAPGQQEGTFESEVFDARNVSRWGRPEVRGKGDFQFWVRTGNVDNPDRNWSSWKRVDLRSNDPLEVPAARFAQWKVVFPKDSEDPAVEYVRLNYRQNNTAPVLEDVYVQPGARFAQQPRITTESNVTVGPSNQPVIPRLEIPQPASRDRNSVAVRWVARDENEDELQFAVYYRGDNEREWKLLKDKITDRHFSWESSLLPDGGYTVKVVATDAPSNVPHEALTASRESARFELDTTPPRIEDLAARVDGGRLQIHFTATDSFSPIRRAEFSVDAGEWQFTEPVGLLADSLLERYRISIPLPVAAAPAAAAPAANTSGGGTAEAAANPGEHVVVVRVYDRFDNLVTAKTVVRR